MSGVRTLVAASALLLCLTGVATAPARAQPGAVDSPGFSIAAAGQESFFVFESKPGRSVTGTVVLTPEPERATEVVLKAVDVTTAATGGIDYGSADPEGVGRWIDLSESRVTLEGGSSVSVPFEVRVPKGARPGDHFAGIVAYDGDALDAKEGAQRQVQLEFVSRLAIATQIIVPGKKRAEVRFTGASIDVAPSGAVLHVSFDNQGNALAEDIVGNVTLSRDERLILSERLEMTSFLPETSVAYPFPFPRTPAEDTYELTGSFQVGDGPRQEIEAEVEFGSEQAEEFEAETGREAEGTGISAVVIVLIALGAAALAALVLLVRERGLARPALGGRAVNLNTAGAEELAALPGIGPRAAARIVDHREEYGRFSSVDELERVEGFDADRIRAFRGRVRV